MNEAYQSPPVSIPSTDSVALQSRRYLGITLSVVIFLLMIGILLAVNYLSSVRQQEITLQIDAVGEMSDASYDLLVATQTEALTLAEEAQTHDDTGEEPTESVTDVSYTEIEELSTYFSKLLTLVRKGGQYGEAGGRYGYTVAGRKRSCCQRIASY